MTECVQPTEKSAAGDEKGDLFPGGPLFERIDWLSFGIAAAATFAVYICTIAPEVTLENGGTWVTGAAYAGVPDTTGYPLWTIYSWLFVKLIPFSNEAWRVTVGSALAAALACGLTALLVSRGGAMLLANTPVFAGRDVKEQNLLRAVSGWVAGMALGLCEAIWSQVARLNVWALSTLLFAAMLALLMRWTARPQRRRFLYGAIFFFGLLLTNSQSMIAISPAIVLWMMISEPELGRELFLVAAILAAIEMTTGLLPCFEAFSHRNVPLLIAFAFTSIWAVVAGLKARRIGSEWKASLICVFVFLSALGLYFYSPIASMTNPPLNWGYPRTVEGYYHLVARGQYDKLWPTTDLGKFVEQLWVVALQIGSSFGWLYFIFIPVPFYLLRRAPRPAHHWMLGLTAAFVCAGPIMVAMLNPTRERQALPLIAPYFSAIYVVLAIWAGLGLMAIGAAISKAK